MGTGAYTYHATKVHAVTAANGNSYAYDAVGNMTTRNSSTYGNQTLSYDEQNRLKQVAISGGSTVQFGYSAGGSRLWKKVNGQITGLWIGSLYEEKDGKILCHVYAGDRLVATFEPQSALACIVQNNRYLAAIWNTGDWALTGLFGHGRAPLSGMGLAILAGLGCGVVYNRRRLWLVHGLTSPHSGRLFRRQVLLTSLAAAILITSVPNEAYAGTPTYDPVFYYYHPDHLGSCQLMTDRNGELVQQYGYTPFGEENYRNNTSAFEVSSRYTGQTLDEDTGLYYYGARYYDPELARFIQADSTVPDPEFSQAYNRYAYAYVYNNPLKFTDPTGQNPFLIAVFMGAYMGGFQGAHHGGISGLLKGALLGGVTAALSFGVGMVGSLIGGPIAGAVTGFAASYALRGTISGDWHFTAMDALNLGVAVVSACLIDPSPSTTDQSLEETHRIDIQVSRGEVGAGGTARDDLDVRLSDPRLQNDPKDVTVTVEVDLIDVSCSESGQHKASVNSMADYRPASMDAKVEYASPVFQDTATNKYYAGTSMKGEETQVSGQAFVNHAEADRMAISMRNKIPLDRLKLVAFTHSHVRHGFAVRNGSLVYYHGEQFSGYNGDLGLATQLGVDAYVVTPSGRVLYHNRTAPSGVKGKFLGYIKHVC